MGKALETVCSYMQIHTAEPALASQQDEVVQRIYTLCQKNGTLMSTSVKAMMANGNATSLCSQRQLCKFWWQPTYHRAGQKPPKVVSHMGL